MNAGVPLPELFDMVVKRNVAVPRVLWRTAEGRKFGLMALRVRKIIRGRLVKGRFVPNRRNPSSEPYELFISGRQGLVSTSTAGSLREAKLKGARIADRDGVTVIIQKRLKSGSYKSFGSVRPRTVSQKNSRSKRKRR